MATILAVVAWLQLAGRAHADRGHRWLWLRNVHTGEEVYVAPFDKYGVPSRIAWRRITYLFRSREGERRTVSPRLLRTLAQVQRHFGNRRIDVYSGYRVPEDERAVDSYHHVGHAADIE